MLFMHKLPIPQGIHQNFAKLGYVIIIVNKYISKNTPCTRWTAVALGYQPQDMGAHDMRCVLCLVAILACARCVRGSIVIRISL